MDDSLKKDAFKFMYAEFGKSIWWQSPDLTHVGNPSANPPPPDLNKAQAESIFHELISKDLLFPAINSKGETCWLIHQGKKTEWENLINPPNWFQEHWVDSLKYSGVFILFSLPSNTSSNCSIDTHLLDGYVRGARALL